MQQTIRIHADAPAKPVRGDACNGCGVCCAAEPCPVGVLVSRRASGACTALAWDAARGRYVCGVLVSPGRRFGGRWLSSRLVARLIAAGQGCDSDAALID